MRITRHYFFIAAVFLTAYFAVVPAENTSDFIRLSCGATQYPQLCYHSLAGYANAVQEDPARLAFMAIRVSFSRVKRMSSYLNALCGPAGNQPDPDTEAAAALRDCRTLYGDAMDLLLGSLKQMSSLSTTGGAGDLRFQMSNVQTWMSAALTNEDTCKDGFEDLADGPAKLSIARRTAKVTAMTSNALALVNNFVSKATMP